jgi:hypothetical protein
MARPLLRLRYTRCDATGSRGVGRRWSNGSVVALFTAVNMWLGVVLSFTGSIAGAPAPTTMTP